MAIWTSLQTFDFDLTDPDNWTVASTGSNNTSFRFEWTAPSGLSYVISGFGFTYANGIPTGGQVDEVIVFNGTSPVGHMYLNATYGTFADAGELFANGAAGFFEHLMRDDDTINGGSGNETFEGHTGNDDINAAGGDDTVIWQVGDGTDNVDGGAGTDELVAKLNGVIGAVWGENGYVRIGDRQDPNNPEQVVAENIEKLTIEMQEAAQLSLATGFSGVLDSIDYTGSEGDDILKAGFADIGIFADGRGGNDDMHGGTKDDTIEGGDGDDTIDGHKGNDTINAGAGDDTIIWNEVAPAAVGGGLDPEGGLDIIDGGADTDTAILTFKDEYHDVTLRNTAGTSIVVDQNPVSGSSLHDDVTLENVEVLELHTGSKADTFDFHDQTGSPTAQIELKFFTGGGNDVLNGIGFDGKIYAETGSGQDSVDGGEGADEIDAGTGHDTVDGQGGDDLIELGSGFDIGYGGEGSDILKGGRDDDVLYGGEDLDQLEGGDGNDTLDGGAGADSIDGGAGTEDVADYSGSAARVTVFLNGIAGIGGDAQGDTLTNIENLIGSNANDFLGGDGGSNSLGGGDSQDILDGQDGGVADTLDGGDGIDTAYYFGATGNQVLDMSDHTNLAKNQGEHINDTWISIEGFFGAHGYTNDLTGDDAANYLLGGSLGDTVSGMDGADHLYGLAGNDTLDGGNGNDVLMAGAGTDTVTGGADQDIFYILTGNGIDIITDWSETDDFFFFHQIGGVSSYGDLTFTDIGADVSITSANDASFEIIVQNRELADLDDQTHFVFG